MAHPKFHGIDRAETDRRTNIAIRELSRAGGRKGVSRRLMQEFDCSHSTAKRIVRRALAALAIDVPTVAAIERERVRRMLNKMIEANGDKEPLKLQVIGKLIDLLGLAQPAKSELAVTIKPFDPIAAYRDNPAIMEKALALEEEVGNARALGSFDAGRDRSPRMAVPPAHPGTPAGGNGDTHQPGSEPPGN